MTKYVLNSGGMRDKPGLSQKFFTEVVKGFGENPKLLLCFFASLREDWEVKFHDDKESIPSLMPTSVTPTFEMAFPDIFTDQLKNADALYIHGGDDHLLQYWLKKFDIPKIFDKKTIAANSAGSNALSKHFWTCDWRECMDGLGVLPIKFLPHYKSSYGNDDPRGSIDWTKAHEELSEYGNHSLPIHALKEGEFVVIES